MLRLEVERPVVCIAGPTASGKTDYALRVAKRLDGEIVNADALQVYSDIQCLSARPTQVEMQGVPHHLFGHVSGDQAYSTGAWLRDVVPVIEAIDRRGHQAILAGGTGLYFQALLSGLADIPSVSASIRNELELMNINALRDEANLVDPVASARILGDDPQRLARVVGVFRATGKALSDWQSETYPVIDPDKTHRIVLLPDREVLYRKINARFDAMIAAGAVEEAEDVKARHISHHAPMLKAIGLSHLLSYLDGECDLEEAVETAKRDTRRLAKRQMTWFRNRCADWTVLSSKAEKDAFIDTL